MQPITVTRNCVDLRYVQWSAGRPLFQAQLALGKVQDPLPLIREDSTRSVDLLDKIFKKYDRLVGRAERR